MSRDGGEWRSPDAEPVGRPLEGRFPTPDPIDLRLSLEPLGHGPADPTIRFGTDGVWLARRTAAGPASLCVWAAPGKEAVMALAWGPGAELALEAVQGLAGLLDAPTALVPHQIDLVGARHEANERDQPALGSRGHEDHGLDHLTEFRIEGRRGLLRSARAAGQKPNVERNSLAGGGLDDPLNTRLRQIHHVAKSTTCAS